VEVINGALRPSNEEITYYTKLVAEFEKAQTETGKAAITFEGKMIDIAAYRRAKAILRRVIQ
jgi:citrate lyase beta subunit